MAKKKTKKVKKSPSLIIRESIAAKKANKEPIYTRNNRKENR